MKISFVLSIRCRGLAFWIWHNISFTAFSWMVVNSNLLFVDSSGVRMDVREDRPNMNGEQKFTQPMNLLSSALLWGIVCSWKTFLLFSNMLMVWPFVMVTPSQSMVRVIRHDFSALTSIPAFWNALNSMSSLVMSSCSVSAASARSSICVATKGFSSFGIIF